ncbi:MAG: hypothetical protein Q7U76_13095 [Nitrospirota bacterium]|nr:hypothetical protein [Nitrospirota bacterium]
MLAVVRRPRERERWLLSKLLRVGPFDESILSLTEPQVSWIMSQFSLDSPVDPKLYQRLDDKVAAMMASEG